VTRCHSVLRIGALALLLHPRVAAAQVPSEVQQAPAIDAADAGAAAADAPLTTPIEAPAPAEVAPIPAPVAPAPVAAAPAAQKADEPEPKKKDDKKHEPVTVFGYIQVHYRHAIAAGADQNVDNDDFRVQRARIGVKGDIYSWLGYDIEVDPRAPEVQGVLRDAFLAFRFIPRHELRVGQQKTQFGYENRVSSSKLYAVNRAELSDNLSRGGVTLRDIGLGLIGDVKLGNGFRIEDAITVVNGDGMNVQADSTKGKDIWGRVGGRYRNKRAGSLDVRVGMSGGGGDFIDEGDNAIDPSDDFRLTFWRVGADIEVDHRWFFVSTEYAMGTDKNTVTGEREKPFGYYVNLVGKTPWQVGPIVRYDTQGNDFKRWTFGVFYRLPDEPFRLLLNYEYRLQRDGVRADDKFYVWLQAAF